MFKQVKQSRAFEEVVSQVQELILQGELRVGEKLPSERQLQEKFKVSRGTLREAFRALEQKGLITVKTGVQGGAIIRPMSNKLMSESLDLLLRYQKISLKELAEFREQVEGMVAAKAARNGTAEDLRRLKNCVRTLESILHSKELRWEEYLAADSEFHFLLARIAGNRMFESVIQTVYENIQRYYEWFLPKRREFIKRNCEDLCQIIQAIENRNPRKAQCLVEGHVRFFNQVMEKGAQKPRLIDSHAGSEG